MNRFWKTVTTAREDEGWVIKLDERPVRTPARATLSLPTQALADAVANEWRDAGETVDPRTMPLTGLANAAIDRVQPDRRALAGGLARYAEADLACYRSEWPPDLVERQAQAWDELIAWARRRYDVDFATTTGLMHVPQPQATIERLAYEVAALDAFRLAGLSPLVTVGGSLIAGLAVLEKALTAAQAWDSVSVDERWQIEQWGADTEAVAALDDRKRDFFAAAGFLERLAA